MHSTFDWCRVRESHLSVGPRLLNLTNPFRPSFGMEDSAVQQGSHDKQQCRTMGRMYPICKGLSSKKGAYLIKRKYKANLKRRWRRDVELELEDRENWDSPDAQ